MIYSHVKSDGKITPIESEKPLALEKLQELVGGYIEFTDADVVGLRLCINEEGRLMGLPINARYPHVVGDVILGRDVVTSDGVEFVGIL